MTTKSIKILLLSLLFLTTTIVPAIARVATLTWDQNPEPEVVGYKIYYKTNTAVFPFNGTSLSESSSPIMVNGVNNTSLVLNLPDDGNIYYFSATAVGSNGLESEFSDIIASEWVPHLLTPSNNEVVNRDVRFVWGPSPTGDNLTYALYYGTDPNLDTSNTAFTTPGTLGSSWPPFKGGALLLLAVLLSMVLALISTRRSRNLWQPVRFGLCIGVFVIQASCGGSGGDDIITSTDSSVTDTGTTPTIPSPTLSTTVVNDIGTTEYQVFLQANTQYYWKIVAQDNWGKTYESLPQKFTTLNK